MNEFLVEIMTRLDISHTEADLKKLKNIIESRPFKLNLDTNTSTKEIKSYAREIQQILKSSFNINLDTRTITSEINQLKKEIDTAGKLQFSIDNGDFKAKVTSMVEKARQWTDESGNARISTDELNKSLENLRKSSEAYGKNNSVENMKELTAAAAKFNAEASRVATSIKQMDAKYAKDSEIQRFHQQVQSFYDKYTATHKQWGGDLREILKQTELGAHLTDEALEKLVADFRNITNAARQAGKLGGSFFDKIKTQASKFTQWTSVTAAVMQTTYRVREAITELKNVDTTLTEISKTADQLSKKEILSIGESSFSSAGKYGKKASDYLVGIQEMYRAGYSNAEDLAELSTLAQSAGDLTADLANDYLIATDAAYKLKGNTKALNDILDGQNYITNRNALSMKDLAEATSIAASQSASSGVAIDQSTAAMGTMIATTRQSGDVAARAWKGILMNIQQVKGEVEDGDIIDDEQLSKYEKASEALGVSLKEVKNGVLSLRDPMKVLEELSQAYTSLDKSDVRRANLIGAVGGKYRGNQLNALLENWDLYEKMLKDYSQGSGSAMEEAMKSANNWEGSLNRLSNTWTDLVSSFANSATITSGIQGINSALVFLKNVLSPLGGLLNQVVTLGDGIITKLALVTAGVSALSKIKLTDKFQNLVGGAKVFAPIRPPYSDGDIERVYDEYGIISKAVCRKRLKWCAV